MRKYLLNLTLLLLISFPLRADDTTSSTSGKYYHSMMDEEKSMILECRADYLEKEIIISQKIRELHKSMNDCMRQNKSDHSDYLKDRESLEELKDLRKTIRSEYMKKMKSIHNF